MNWLIFGAGAIGTYIGGSLIMHGQKVVFLERPEVAAELQERGLRLNLHGQEHRIVDLDIYSSLPYAVSHTAFDVMVFAVKSYDTLAAIDLMLPCLDQLPAVLCLQNGVENEQMLETSLGKERVIPGTVTSSILRRKAGDVVLERLRGIGISSQHPLANQLAQTMNTALLNVRLYPSAAAMKWSKMLTNLLANASSAILDMTPAQILSHPGLFSIELAQIRETIAVMKAHGITVVDLPNTPVRALAWLSSQLPATLSRPLIALFAGKGRGDKPPSFHIDLHSGKGASEVGYLNGAVVRFGERANIPTPVNYWLAKTLLMLTHGVLPLDEYAHKPDKFIQAAHSAVIGPAEQLSQ